MKLTRISLLVVSISVMTNAADWPQWRGMNRDGVWRETGIVERIPEEGLKVRWRAKVGSGYSAPSVAAGRVFITDHVLEPELERVLCFDEATGKQLWMHSYAVAYKDTEYGNGPRAAPTVADGKVYTLGTLGHLSCLDATTGAVLWNADLIKKFAGKVPMYGMSAAPLVVGENVIVMAGGKPDACVVALDRKTGETRWQALPDRVAYSSPIVITAGGCEQLIVWTADAVTSLDPPSGKIHWQVKWEASLDPSHMVATPVRHDDLLLALGSWSRGSKMLKLDAAKPAATVLWEARKEPRTLHSTPLFQDDGHCYAILHDGSLACLNPATGEQVWSTHEPTGKRLGNAHLARHGDRVFIFNHTGHLILAHLTPKGYEERGRCLLVEPTAVYSGKWELTWAHPAFANQCAFVRNDRELMCGLLATADQAPERVAPPPRTPSRVADYRAPAETPEQARARHERVAQRRAGPGIFVHRGAWEFAHENTLEAFRAAFELGADGNEMDIQATKDGVLVLFHDETVEMQLEAVGEVADFTWAELQRIPFRRTTRFGAQCRIPTLEEVFELHRRHAGLLQLDTKRPGLDGRIAALLTRLDMWDQVAHANPGTCDLVRKDPRCKLRRQKSSGFYEKPDTDAEVVRAWLALPGDDVMVEDPRAAAVALGRKPRRPSDKPVREVTPLFEAKAPTRDEIERHIALLRDTAGFDQIPSTPEAVRRRESEIAARAHAADALGRVKESRREIIEALVIAAKHRRLSPGWRWHGADASSAMWALGKLRAPELIAVTRAVVWPREPQPDLAKLLDPAWKNAAGVWQDWRLPWAASQSLLGQQSAEAAAFCRDYLALSSAAAKERGQTWWDWVPRLLLDCEPTSKTALELLRHREPMVRRRAILVCLAHADQRWAVEALEQAAPEALPLRFTP